MLWLYTDLGNATSAGIEQNVEQVAIAKSWEDPHQRYIANKLDSQFSELWSSRDENCVVVPLPEAIRRRLLSTYAASPAPTEKELDKLYQAASNRGRMSIGDAEMEEIARENFRIPSGLLYDAGPFAHQGKAVESWCDNNYRGILEMATGSGKTIAAMIGAHRLSAKKKPLLVVVSAPYVPLIQQWCDELASFGLNPVNLTATRNARERGREIGRVGRRLRFRKGVVAVVVSHRLLCSSDFKSEIAKIGCPTLLIGDEVHNLGAEGFVKDPPEFIQYRLGLSATPVRQYDQLGTDALQEFFGPVVFRVGLEDAIGRCLVEYDYHVHLVRLGDNEMEDWYDLTGAIRANAWRMEEGQPDGVLARLFRKRRLLLETAERKVEALQAALDREDVGTLRHTLIYASDKAPEQLETVNSILRSRGIWYHQLTQHETADREETRRIIRGFQEGTLRVLTAKRVLDEGVNIPQIRKAFILASTTVERQWVQRRGRLLRKCEEIGKTSSEIHDFMVVPPEMDECDEDARQ